jgi:group I intron endonuclease
MGNFTWGILEQTEPTKEALISREQFYIETLCPEYNLNPVAATALGMTRSEETRLKISVAGKGRKPSQETRMKMSQAHRDFWEANPGIRQAASSKLRGRVCSEETKRRMSEGAMGHKVTKETLDKMSVSLKGRVIDEGWRHKLSMSTKGRPFTEEHKMNLSLAGIGRPVSDETRQRMSIALKEYNRKIRENQAG